MPYAFLFQDQLIQQAAMQFLQRQKAQSFFAIIECATSWNKMEKSDINAHTTPAITQFDCTKPGLKFGKIVIESDNVMRMNTKAKLKFM